MTVRPLTAALLVALSAHAQANIDIQFDYSHDSSHFFTSNTDALATLNSVAAVFETRFTDSLTAITSTDSNSFDAVFFNPSNPSASNITRSSDSFGADVIRVYVGGAALGSGSLGLGGTGGFDCSGIDSFCSNAPQRGQGDLAGANAIDVALWGGSISFNTIGTNWHFGSSIDGLETNEADFYSVAVHELAHVLGFGTADSFNARVNNSGQFIGSAAGTVVLSSDKGHWAEGTQSAVNSSAQEAAMDPTIFIGTRKYFTELDFAAMQAIGWQVTAVPEADTWAMLLAGLGLVGFAARRRRA